jgi:DMSO/TMAO reductase YedYZ molybdopterin-dependent catalytic subunit/thiosulfate reductase cytochrome b subunit
MGIEVADPGFSLWLVFTHFFNFLFITLLVRSGIQILSDHPRLYWNDHCTPGSEWIKFTKVKVPLDRYYTSLDDAVYVSPWIALPGGRHSLGLGRHWHFLCASLWGLNGFVYVIHLFLTDSWRRLIPTSWDIFPGSWNAFISYLTFHLPPAAAFQPYDPLQQLAYAFIVFICAPLTILTGIAMSPAFIGRFPWYAKIFGGRQAARSIHFLLMITYLLFLIIHVTMIIVTGFSKNLVHIVLGKLQGDETLAVQLAVVGIGVVIAIHIAATIWSGRKPRQVQSSIGACTQKIMTLLFYPLKSKQNYGKSDISPYHWVNGYLPKTEEWLDLSKNNFASYQLEIKGLVENPSSLSLNDLKALPRASQIVKHCCIQGWTGIAEWSGVSMSEIIRLARPLPQARYIIFHSYQMNKQQTVSAEMEVEYYGSIDLKEAMYPQTILAYEMNGSPLPENYGAPLRLRMETKLGFKMVKWIKSIEFVEDYRKIGLGRGGYREDNEYYNRGAQI